LTQEKKPVRFFVQTFYLTDSGDGQYCVAGSNFRWLALEPTKGAAVETKPEAVKTDDKSAKAKPKHVPKRGQTLKIAPPVEKETDLKSAAPSPLEATAVASSAPTKSIEELQKEESTKPQADDNKPKTWASVAGKNTPAPAVDPLNKPKIIPRVEVHERKKKVGNTKKTGERKERSDRSDRSERSERSEKPDRERKPRVEKNVKPTSPNLYIRQLPKDATEEQIKAVFGGFGKIEKVELVAGKAFGFVTYETLESATAAYDASFGEKGVTIGDSKIFVQGRKEKIEGKDEKGRKGKPRKDRSEDGKFAGKGRDGKKGGKTQRRDTPKPGRKDGPKDSPKRGPKNTDRKTSPKTDGKPKVAGKPKTASPKTDTKPKSAPKDTAKSSPKTATKDAAASAEKTTKAGSA